MKNTKILLFIFVVFHFYSFKPFQDQKDKKYAVINEKASQDTIGTLNGVYSIPEMEIFPSPTTEKHFTFPPSDKIIDYDVSPAGLNVATVVAKSDRQYLIKFWQIGTGDIADSCLLPKGLLTKAISWHPNANALFVMGVKGSDYQIYRIEKKNNQWMIKTIFTTPYPLRRLVVSPRPFTTNFDKGDKKDYYAYRLFFGMDNGDKSFRIVSITEYGKRFYQVVGPSKTFSKAPELGAYVPPSEMQAEWALPVAFHPAGHQLIWEDKSNVYNVANYDSRYWGEFKPLKIELKINGTMTPTPNGLGLIHWQKDKPGIGIYLLSTKKEQIQRPEYKFVSTPSSVPDGKGIVGLTFLNGRYTLNYLPINVPLADVMNAWMFADSAEEVDLFQKYYGLFRPNRDDQLYKLYETENYYCNSYDRNAPTRPYIVTTDLFWELFGAAYEGLFIVKERDEAIPDFWKFISEAGKYLKNSNKPSPWTAVFSALNDLYSGNNNNPEVIRILKQENSFTEILKDIYSYSDLKPRGHYTSSPEMEKYFRAFRYFTTIYKNKKDTLQELNLLPTEINAYAEKWIKSYSGFIAPSRSPLVWKNLKQTLPGYCRYPQSEPALFPLSWGFDNEILYSTVYHSDFPSELQVKGPGGERMLPLGVDLAAALGNGFAEKLMDVDYKKYPPLRKVIENLKQNFTVSSKKADFKENLYNQWMDAMAVQWADFVHSTNGMKGNDLWQTKRLQTGLATWATLRHATVLVNERTAAECGEGGFEEILMRAPRGYVEPDPYTFEAIADLFDSAVKYVSKNIAGKSDIKEDYSSEKRSLYDGIVARLKETAQEARKFKSMAEKERKGESLTNEENEKILYVSRVGEHLFLVFNSLSNKDYALSTPDPMAKIADVAGDGTLSPYLMSAVGNPMEWDYVVPFYGRHQIVKGSVYSYYEFKSRQLLNDKEWREKVTKQEYLPWIKPFITNQSASGMANTCY